MKKDDITPVLNSFDALSHDPIEEWVPVSDAEVHYELTLGIGTVTCGGADLYLVTIVTPQSISNLNLGREMAEAKRKYLVVSPYSWSNVEARVSEILALCEGDTYRERTEILKDYFDWEGNY